jgi:sphingomyelin phosphodiesterase
MGNHESWPVNVYDYQGTREQVLNAGLANSWRDWLNEKAYNELATKGFYSIELP